jgi:hypothetical protein
MIYRMFDGRHIDLSKILEVGDVHNGFGHPSFHVVFQLFDNVRSWDSINSGRTPHSFDDVYRGHAALMEAWTRFKETSA